MSTLRNEIPQKTYRVEFFLKDFFPSDSNILSMYYQQKEERRKMQENFYVGIYHLQGYQSFWEVPDTGASIRAGNTSGGTRVSSRNASFWTAQVGGVWSWNGGSLIFNPPITPSYFSRTPPFYDWAGIWRAEVFRAERKK